MSPDVRKRLERPRGSRGPSVPTTKRRDQRTNPLGKCKLSTRTSRVARSANETLVRVFFAYLVDPAEAEAFLRREADAYRSYLVTLEEIAAGPAKTLPERASWLTVDAGVRVTRATLEWAENAIEEVRLWRSKPPRRGKAPAGGPRDS
jgi:Virulence activator alpha C-term